MWAYQPSRLWECWAASCRPAPVVIRITSGTLNCPPDMCSSEAALFRIWSSASRLKLTVMISTIGRIPPRAAPMPAPTNPDSDSGVSRIRSGPELLQQPQADREAAAVAADVLAHQEDPVVAPHRLAHRLAHAPRGRSSPPAWCAVSLGPWPGCSECDEPGQVLDRLQRRRSAVSTAAVQRRPTSSRARPRSSSSSWPLGPHRVGEQVDRVALPPPFDLGLVAVAVGVVHRVRPEPVGAQLQEDRPAAAADLLDRPAWRRPRRPARPSRRPATPPCRTTPRAAPGRSGRAPWPARYPSRRGCSRSRTAPAAATAPPGSAPRGTRPRRPHRRRRSRRSPGRGRHPVGERQPDRQRDARRRRWRCRPRSRSGVEQVHRAAAAAAAAGLLAEHLGHHRVHRHARGPARARARGRSTRPRRRAAAPTSRR